MTKQEYQHIRNLAWMLLADSKTQSLPVDITKITKQYQIDDILDFSKTRYANAIMIAEKILAIYGYPSDEEYCKFLAVRILSPLIVLKELNIQSSHEIKVLCDIPNQIATQRFSRLQMLLKRNKFGISDIELSMLKNFAHWINEHNHSSSSK